MTDQPTQAFNPAMDETVAYVRPPVVPWRVRGEAIIERVRDFYDAVWDVMPAIAATGALIWFITNGPHAR